MEEVEEEGKTQGLGEEGNFWRSECMAWNVECRAWGVLEHTGQCIYS